MNRLVGIAIMACWLTGPAGSTAQDKPAQPADLVLNGGNFYTGDLELPRASALAARDGLIIAVGSNADVKPLIGPRTEVIDLQGKFAMAGFIEGHGHLLGIGSLLMELNLTETRDWDEIIELVALAAAKAKPGEWIVGRGWHQSKWDQPPKHHKNGYPIHTSLSTRTPNNPVLLVHRSGHMSFANAAAMKLAGVTAETKAPAGGEILRDETGRPIGVFRETAQAAVHGALSRSRENRSAAEQQLLFERQVELAQRECLAHGVTSFQDAGMSPGNVRRLADLAERGKLDLRIWVMLRAGNDQLAREIPRLKSLRRGGDARVTVGGIKQMIDGALGAHGAWLLKPYADLPESRGLNTTSVAAIEETARIAMEHDLQLCVHAIGDRANREVLDLFERTFKQHPDRRNLRWRIEHAQHLHPDDIPRFARLGVIASMQANHCTSDGPFVVSRLGEQRARQGAYAWHSLLESGAVLCNGTDAPVENVDPLRCFYSAVTRKLADGRAFFPQQCMTRQQALAAYTSSAAYAARQEQAKGTLTVGKLADVVVLTHDLYRGSEADVRQARVLLTILGGKVVYRR